MIRVAVQTLCLACLCALSAHAAVTVSLAPAPAAVYSDTAAERVLRISNDTQDPLRGPCVIHNSTWGLRYTTYLRLDPGASATCAFQWQVPHVSSITRLQLQVDVGGQQHQLPLAIYPASLLQKVFSLRHLRMAYYAPHGEEIDLFAAFDLWPTRMLTLRDLTGIDVLFLGRDTCRLEGVASAQRSERLREFVYRGGRIIVLPQSVALPFLPEPMAPSIEAATRYDLLAGTEYDMRGMRDSDLSDWGAPVGLGGFDACPTCSEWPLVADAEGRTVLGLVGYGQGVVGVCQLDVTRWLPMAPQAAKLFRVLVQRVLQYQPPAGRVQVLQDSAGQLGRELDRLGVRWEPFSLNTPIAATACDVLLIEATVAQVLSPFTFRPLLAAGASAVIVHPTRPTRPVIKDLVGAPVKMRPEPLARLVRLRDFPLIQGIPAPLLAWSADTPLSDIGMHTIYPRADALLVKDDPADRLAAVLQLQVGHGQLVLWAINHRANPQGNIAWSRFLSALNVARP